MSQHRPPYGAAALTGLAVFALYVVTLAPTTGFWDTSEYIATAHTLGIPHPPGNALFVVLARVWSLLLAPLGLSVAVRINLFAAATSAGASFFFFLVAHRVLTPVLGDARRALVGAAASAVLGATAFTVWNQSNVNEKVYTLSVLIMAAVAALAVRWYDRRGVRGSERYLLAALFLMVLGSTNHLMSVLALPALGALVLLANPMAVLRPAFLWRAVVLAVVGLSFNFFLPIRAAQNPVINEGDPTCDSFGGAVAAVYSNGKAGCPMLADNLARTQYAKPPVTERMSPLKAQLQNYWQYFDWQWARGVDPSELPSAARLPLTLLFLGLGLAGLWATWLADRRLFAFLGVFALTLTFGLVYYLNFKYGYSLSPEIADRGLHEVRERDYFFIGSFIVWGFLAGMGLSWIWGILATRTGSGGNWAAASPVFVVAFIPLVLNWSWASRAGDHAARDWAYNFLMSVEPYGVIFTNGDNDTFPLWYIQEVEEVRQDVTVIVGQYLFTSWYPKQLAELTAPDRQRRFDPAHSAGIYEEPPAPPARSITRLTPDQMDVVLGARADRDMTVSFPQLAVTYTAGTGLDRSAQLALAIIRDAIEERPIYFAASGGMMSQLGLERWGVRHGLAVKLELRRLDGPQPPQLVQGSPQYGAEYFDLERSLHLYDTVYGYRGIRDRPIWQDRATLNIPWHFYALALQLADAARTAGLDQATVARLEDDALGFQVVAAGGARGTPEGS